MSGILDSKTRVLDVLLTQEGRRQLASGQMQIKYVAFTDDATYYRPDIASGSADATERVYLEACNLPQDQVTFEASDGGRLNPFKNVQGIVVRDGRIISSSFDRSAVLVTSSSSGKIIFNLTGSSVTTQFLTGSEFASSADALLLNSVDSFEKLRVLSTKGRLFDEDRFVMSSGELNFKVTPDKPLGNYKRVSINDLEGLISDPRLSTQKNFKFLPPINKPIDLSIDTKADSAQVRDLRVATYEPWGPTTSLTPADVHSYVDTLKALGFVEGANGNLGFNPTSKSNNLFGQFFELTSDELKKLDVVDFGRHVYDYDGVTYNRHYFFVGRVLTDDNGDDTFVHLFTLVFM